MTGASRHGKRPGRGFHGRHFYDVRLNLRTDDFDIGEFGGQMVDESPSSLARNVIRRDSPMLMMKDYMILMCFDAESLQGDASESGFAWLDTPQVCDNASGRNGWPFIKLATSSGKKVQSTQGATEPIGYLQPCDGSTVGPWDTRPNIITPHVRHLDYESVTWSLRQITRQACKWVYI